MGNLTITQRRFLNEHMKDALVNRDFEGSPYFKKLGPATQSVMREAVNYHCLYKPLKGKVSEETFKDGDGNEIKKEYVTFKIDLFQPGSIDKISLERKFSKSELEEA
jgi:hypothetical protein